MAFITDCLSVTCHLPCAVTLLCTLPCIRFYPVHLRSCTPHLSISFTVRSSVVAAAREKQLGGYVGPSPAFRYGWTALKCFIPIAGASLITLLFRRRWRPSGARSSKRNWPTSGHSTALEQLALELSDLDPRQPLSRPEAAFPRTMTFLNRIVSPQKTVYLFLWEDSSLFKGLWRKRLCRFPNRLRSDNIKRESFLEAEDLIGNEAFRTHSFKIITKSKDRK